jgi:hypothetical protein
MAIFLFYKKLIITTILCYRYHNLVLSGAVRLPEQTRSGKIMQKARCLAFANILFGQAKKILFQPFPFCYELF